MTTYKEIKGTQIEAVSSDPSNPIEGQVWYNTTDNVLKGQAATTAGAWSSGGNLNTGRRAFGGAGTQTSALALVEPMLLVLQVKQNLMMELVRQREMI